MFDMQEWRKHVDMNISDVHSMCDLVLIAASSKQSIAMLQKGLAHTSARRHAAAHEARAADGGCLFLSVSVFHLCAYIHMYTCVYTDLCFNYLSALTRLCHRPTKKERSEQRSFTSLATPRLFRAPCCSRRPEGSPSCLISNSAPGYCRGRGKIRSPEQALEAFTASDRWQASVL